MAGTSIRKCQSLIQIRKYMINGTGSLLRGYFCLRRRICSREKIGGYPLYMKRIFHVCISIHFTSYLYILTLLRLVFFGVPGPGGP